MIESDNSNLLEVKNLKMYFPIYQGLLRRLVSHIRAVDGVSFFIREGETLGLVGESGCGKTTVGRCIVRAYQPTDGEILYRKDGKYVDLTKIPYKKLKIYRRDIQMIFQDPFSSLNPYMTVLDIVGEPLKVHKIAQGRELKSQVKDLLNRVGLSVKYISRYPNAFSGGQRQRIGIARTLALKPKLIIADEPVSALDVSIQAQVINLMKDLQGEFGLTYLFIAHDLSIVEHISDRVLVMYLGSMAELVNSEELYFHPLHPYTEALLSAVPKFEPGMETHRILLPGEVPNPSNPPSGCKFHPRCRYAREICSKEVPKWRDMGNSHYVACHLADQLTLQGITNNS